MSEVRSFGTDNQLLFDDALIEDKSGFELTLNPPEKAERPALEPETSWEAKGVHASSVVEGEDGVHRLYYGATGEDGRSICLATSANGVDWERPSLGLVEYDGSKDNNLLIKGFSRGPDALGRDECQLWGGAISLFQGGTGHLGVYWRDGCPFGRWYPLVEVPRADHAVVYGYAQRRILG